MVSIDCLITTRSLFIQQERFQRLLLVKAEVALNGEGFLLYGGLLFDLWVLLDLGRTLRHALDLLGAQGICACRFLCTPHVCFSAAREGNRRTQCSGFSTCHMGTGCTLHTCFSACHEGRGCTPCTHFSACRGGRACTSCTCFSACRADTGYTPCTGFSASRACTASFP